MVETNEEGSRRNGGSRPVPDPTVLTTEQLVRSVRAERDYVDGLVAVLKERLDGIDRATELLNQTVNRVPTAVQVEVSHLRELQDEKFESIEIQFRERDTRSERESRDNKVAVDAAFAAQKEAAAKQDESNQKAIDKSEVSTTEKITKLAELFQTSNQAINDKIDDVKERVGKIEAVKVGVVESRTGIYAAIGLVASVIVVGIAIIGFIASHGG
jgi:cation transport regulator ChaB